MVSMRHIKSFLLILSIIGFFFISIINYDISEKKVFTSLGKAYSTFLSLDEVDTDANSLNSLLDLADKNNILLSVTQRETINQEEYDMTYVSFNKISDFSKILNITQTENSTLLLPKQTPLKNATFQEFLNNDHIGYSLLTSYWETHDYDITLSVHYDLEDEYNAFLLDVSELFSVSENILKSTAIAFDDNYMEIVDTINNIYYIVTAIVMLAIGVMLAYELTKRSKEIAIKKLNGYRDDQLIKEHMRTIILQLSFITFVLLLISVIILHSFKFAYYFALHIIPILFIEVFMLFIIYKILLGNITISEVIKQKKMSTKVMTMNYVLRFILLITISFLLIMSLSNFFTYKQKAEKFKEFSKYRDFLTFQTYAITTKSDEEILALQNQAYQVWDKDHNGLYADFSCSNNDPDAIPCLSKKQFAQTNINFLNYFKDNFSGLKVLDFNELNSSDTMYVLTPVNQTVDRELILNDISDFYQITSDNVKFIDYEKVVLPTLSDQIIGDGNFTVTNPVIYVINDFYYQKAGAMFFNSFAGIMSMKFDPGLSNREELYQELVDSFPNIEIKDVLKLRNFDRIDKSVSQEISSYITLTTILGSMLITLLLFYLTLIYSINKMMISDNKKEIAIQYISGYKLHQIILPYLKDNLLLLLLASILIIFILFIILKQSLILILINLICISIIEFGFLYASCKIMIQKKIIPSLKGEA